MKEVIVIDSYDGFDIQVGSKLYMFNQEDTHERLLEVFEDLGITATYEEVC